MQMPGVGPDDAAKLIVLFDFLPAEFDNHAGTWMLWPDRVDGFSRARPRSIRRVRRSQGPSPISNR